VKQNPLPVIPTQVITMTSTRLPCGAEYRIFGQLIRPLTTMLLALALLAGCTDSVVDADDEVDDDGTERVTRTFTINAELHPEAASPQQGLMMGTFSIRGALSDDGGLFDAAATPDDAPLVRWFDPAKPDEEIWRLRRQGLLYLEVIRESMPGGEASPFRGTFLITGGTGIYQGIEGSGTVSFRPENDFLTAVFYGRLQPKS
jgi:hypothetical protein